MSCALKRPCRELHQLLEKIEDEKIPFRCSGSSPCEYAFNLAKSVAQAVNVDSAQEIEETIKKINKNQLPIESSRQALELVFNEDPFYCPELQADIWQPCQVRSCTYWADKPWTRNCIWYYKHSWHRDVLENSELAFLLDVSSSMILKRVHLIVAKLRRNFVRSAAASLRDPTTQNSSDAPRCTGCGALIQDKNAHHYRKGYIYCSRDCVKKKPPVEARIEDDFSLPLERVLQICLESFVGKRPICHALEITGPQLDEILARHELDPALICS